MYPPLDNGRAVTNLQKSQALAGRFCSASALQSEDDPRWDPAFTLTFRAYLQQHKADFVSTDAAASYNCPLTMHELTLTLENLKPSTPGSDLLPPWFFKHTGVITRACLLQFYNASFAAGRLPPAFKRADLVPIPKPGRDHRLEKNFRPISLLLVVARIMDSIIQRRLYYWAEKRFILPPTQAAFRRFSSSVHPLLRLTQEVRTGFHHGRQTGLVRLDLSAAFDTVNPDILRYKLHTMGLRGRLLAWIADFLADRSYRVVRPATTEYANFGIGVPQGSGLSPLLFILFISECSHILHCSHAEYADDITLWYTSSDPNTMRAMLNQDLRTIECWARRMRMRFGEKNKFFLFHPVGSTAFDLKALGGLHFYSTPLESSTECVLLGLHLDASLTFRRHTDHLVASAKRRGNMMRCLLSTRLAHNASALLVLYKGWIRAKIEYASEVYCTFARTHAKRLERAQAHCLRIILGVRQSTPHAVLQNECSVSSLESRRSKAALLKYAKILSLPRSHPLRSLLHRWWYQESEREREAPRPATFFEFATREHLRLCRCRPPQELAPSSANPVSLPPWSSLYTPANKVDVHALFRRRLRECIRAAQMVELRATPSAARYNELHPEERREWLSCLPAGGSRLRVIARLRSGYADIGRMLPYREESRCQRCGAFDTVEHLLLRCMTLIRERGVLFDLVAQHTEVVPSVSVLLGFAPFPSHILRLITTATAKFVIAARRWP